MQKKSMGEGDGEGGKKIASSVMARSTRHNEQVHRPPRTVVIPCDARKGRGDGERRVVKMEEKRDIRAYQRVCHHRR
jgi:hypothetical protein